MKDRIDSLEKQIRGRMLSIKTKQITPAESRIGYLFKTLKEIDEPLYDKLLAEYKIVLQNLK